MTARRYRLPLAALAALATLVALGPGLAEDAVPLTNEDIVRAFVTGTPESELIARIEKSRVAFDTSDEMLTELRLAGIPTSLLEAMVDRQKAQDAADNPGAAEPAEPAEAALDNPTGEPVLTIVLASETDDDGEAAEPQMLRVLDVPHPDLLAQLRVRDRSARTTDVAIFLGCRTADHVPDQWRSKSPLGRDFNTPRHRLLQFIGGATSVDAGKAARGIALPEGQPAPAILELIVPESFSTPLESEIAHDLTLGVAFEIGGRFYLMAQAPFDDVLFAPGVEAGTLRAEVSTPRNVMEFVPTVRFESTELE